MKTFCLILLLTASPLLAAESVTLEGLKFDAPQEWISLPVTSPMRKATWRTSAESNAAEISFFAFGKGQGGSVNENIQRWYGQFSESATKAESATVTVNNRPITFAKSEGIFSSGIPGGPTTPLPDYALYGAIIETDSGAIFIKMTGPKTTVKAAEKAFTDLVTSAVKS